MLYSYNLNFLLGSLSRTLFKNEPIRFRVAIGIRLRLTKIKIKKSEDTFSLYKLIRE